MRDTQTYNPSLGIWPRNYMHQETTYWYLFTQIPSSFKFVRRFLGGIWCFVASPAASFYTGWHRIPVALYDLCGDKSYDLATQRVYAKIPSGALTIWFEFYGKEAKKMEQKERAAAKIGD